MSVHSPAATGVQLADAIEAAAYRELFAAAPAELAAALRIATREIAGATLLMAPAIPDAFFNRVIGLGVHEPPTEAALDTAIAAYRASGAAQWWIHVAPAGEQGTLAGWLEARGFRPAARSRWAKFLRGTAPPPAVQTQSEVRRARPDESAAVAQTIGAAYGMPPPLAAWMAAVQHRPGWRAYAAFEADRMIGAGLLYLEGRNAWLGAGAVRPEARGKHVHRALMAVRIRAAVEAGCTQIATETGVPLGDEPNPSLANIVHCGFENVGSRLNYAAPAA